MLHPAQTAAFGVVIGRICCGSNGGFGPSSTTVFLGTMRHTLQHRRAALSPYGVHRSSGASSPMVISSVYVAVQVKLDRLQVSLALSL